MKIAFQNETCEHSHNLRIGRESDRCHRRQSVFRFTSINKIRMFSASDIDSEGRNIHNIHYDDSS
jgi:hypothetical protein